MWGLDHKEGWLPKNWCFWTVVLLRVLWTARRSNQSILKEINPEYSLKGLLLKLKLQYFGYLMWRSDSLEKILMLGKIEDKRRSWQQRMRWLDRITDSVEINLNKIWRIEEDRGVGHAAVHGVVKNQVWPSDWTTATNVYNRESMRTCSIAQGPLLSTLWWPKWERNLKKRACIHTCNWFTLLYSKN